MILNFGAPFDTAPSLCPPILLLGVDSELLPELLALLSLELVILSLLEDSDEARDFFLHAFLARRFAFFLRFFSRRYCFSLSALASSFKYCLPDLSILRMISQILRTH